MSPRTIAILLILGAWCSPDYGRAQEAPSPKRLLRLADTATRKVKAVSYQASYSTEGDFHEAGFTGRVLAHKTRRSWLSKVIGDSEEYTAMRIECRVTPPRGEGAGYDLLVATDGREAYHIDHAKQKYMKCELSQARELFTLCQQPAHPLFMIEYFHPTPFSDEINGRETRYEGVKTVGGVECDVIYVIYDIEHAPESRWYFGRKDHLPRRVERIFTGGKRILELSQLNTSPKIDDADFRPAMPAGYVEAQYTAPQNSGGRCLLKVGTPAPAWELKTPDGRVIRLQDLQGQVVVMEFWATWSEHCQLAMPSMQNLHDRFAGQPVRVLGLNVWDDGHRAARLMQEKQFTYETLQDANAVADAYHVSRIPAVYVIEGRGNVHYALDGYRPDMEAELQAAVNQALSGSGPGEK